MVGGGVNEARKAGRGEAHTALNGAPPSKFRTTENIRIGSDQETGSQQM